VDDSHISCLKVNENLSNKFQGQGTHLLTYLLKNILKDLDEIDTVLIPRIVGGQSPEKGNHFILWVCMDKKKQKKTILLNSCYSGYSGFCLCCKGLGWFAESYSRLRPHWQLQVNFCDGPGYTMVLCAL
jgi:hypothetical protein